MANDNRVFVSPGVYTSEKDLSFVSQSVGVTTLGLVGETTKGPAFEPLLVSSYSEFTTYFGGMNPEKFVDSQIPKYELPYIAKGYLQQSNQLFVTRILGYSGYDAGPSWSITTIGNLDCESVAGYNYSNGEKMAIGDASADGGSVTNLQWFLTGGTYLHQGWFDNSLQSASAGIGTILHGKLNKTIFNYDGSTTTLKEELNSFFSSFGALLSHPYIYCGTGSTLHNGADLCGCNVTGGTGEYPSLAWGYGCAYSAITANAASSAKAPYHHVYTAFTATERLGSACGPFWCPEGATDAEKLCFSAGTLCSDNNDPWFYSFFDYVPNTGPHNNGIYTGFSFQITISGACDISQNYSGVTSGSGGDTTNTNVYGNDTTILGNNAWSGNTSIVMSFYSAATLCNYHNQVVATLRSRGLSTLSSGGPEYYVTGDTNNGTDVTFICTGSTYDDVLTDPFATFAVDIDDKYDNSYFFEASMSPTSKNYLPRVMGRAPFDKVWNDVPLFVEEIYPNALTYAYKKGYVRGLDCGFKFLPSFRAQTNTDTIAFYQENWQTPVTPYVVSELRGTKVFDLFRFISIADGDSANLNVKVSVINVSLERKEFDLIVRDFYDSDSSPIVLEKFTRCSMNPTLPSYVGKKVGTYNGDYQLNSKYVMLDIIEEIELDSDLWDAVPCGFRGYTTRKYDAHRSPTLYYKTKYDTPGEVIFNPPLGSTTGASNREISAGDNVRRTYLGISDTRGYDSDFFMYKGKTAPTDKCADSDGPNWPCVTQGFHMDSGATCNASTEFCKVILCGCPAGASGTTNEFATGAADFTTEPNSSAHPYYKINSRKFTLMFAGGFDGWDIYRKTRTNEDTYRRGQTGYLNGACSTTEYTTATGDGSFKPSGSENATTDYYAYLDGILTFENPEAIDINVFSTPGIDMINNTALVNESIEMIEGDRADSLYVSTTPDYNMYVKTSTDPLNRISSQEAVDNLEASGIDSNYTATYYPWVRYKDMENNVQIWLPPTYDVMRNIALTDNVAFPWFASAGYTRGIVNAVRARTKLTLDERDTLYTGRINPIATFSDVGTIIFGNKTLQVKESALDRINVRRLLLQARKLISAVAVRLLFEQNDEQVRNEFLDLVNPILDSIRRERGLTDFRVVVSDDPALIDQNTLQGKIYIKPTRSLEFIDIEFLITPTGAEFENI